MRSLSLKKSRMVILGYSSLAQRLIIPALNHHPNIKLVGIASKSRYKLIPGSIPAYSSYTQAICNTDCNLVYISLHNSAHYKWILYALKHGKQVICDKPAVLTRRQALICAALAKDKQIIFESLPYLFHPQHQLLSRKLIKAKSQIKVIQINFGFPSLPSYNFRNQKQLGGGCIYDIGPYPISAGYHYFHARPKSVVCLASNLSTNSLPTQAAVILNFGLNQIVQATFGFDLEYRNHLEIWGKDFHYLIDRAFSIPKDYKNMIYYKSHDQVKILGVPPADHFRNMFHAFSQIPKSSYRQYNQAFLDRALILDAMIASSKTGRHKIITYQNL